MKHALAKGESLLPHPTSRAAAAAALLRVRTEEAVSASSEQSRCRVRMSRPGLRGRPCWRAENSLKAAAKRGDESKWQAQLRGGSTGKNARDKERRAGIL